MAWTRRLSLLLLVAGTVAAAPVALASAADEAADASRTTLGTGAAGTGRGSAAAADPASPPAAGTTGESATPAARAAAAATAAHPAKALIDAAAVAMRDDPEASRRDAEAALAMLARAPNPELEIRAHLALCDYWSERDALAARREIAAGRALLERSARKGLAAGLQTCEGETRIALGDNAGALGEFESAVQIASEAGDDEMLAGALFSRGYLLGVQGRYADGLADLRRAQGLYEKVGMKLHALTALNSIAIQYNRMGDYAEAQHIYERALAAQRAARMRREEAVTLHNLGRVHENLAQWDEANRAFEGSLAINRSIGYLRGEAYALRGLAAVAVARGDPRGALVTLERASALQAATPDARLQAQIDLARGMAYKELARFPESIAALESSRRVFGNGGALNEVAQVNRELAMARAAIGDWRAAYESQLSATAASESLLRNQLDQRFAALKIEFDTAAREKENALLLRENASGQEALAQQMRARALQATVIGLTVLLALVLATLVVRQRRGTLRMRALAMTDELTGAPNRRAVLQRLESALVDRELPCALLVIDLDHFKSINDQLGHPVGDEVLRRAAQALRGVLVEPAFFGRLGGEEFLAVLPRTSLEAACRVGENVRARILAIDMSAWWRDGRQITASIGVTEALSPDDTSTSLLQRADAALYSAKRAGRNRVSAYTAPVVDLAAHPARQGHLQS